MAAFMVLYFAAELELKRVDAELLEVRLRRKSAAARLNHLKRMLKDNPSLANDIEVSEKDKEDYDPNAEQYQVDGASDEDVRIAESILTKTGTPAPNLTGADNTLAKNNERKLELSNGTSITRVQMEGYIKFYDETGDKIKADGWRKTLAEFDQSER